jgi:uncharacterized repeat protein (TIGR01451 family)
MVYQYRRKIVFVLLSTGLFLGLIGVNGEWGPAYGQTAGPTPPPGRVALNLTLEVDNPRPRPGDVIEFTMRITNSGDAPAHGVRAVDVLPGAFALADVQSTAGSRHVDAQTITVDIPQLAPGATAIIVIRANAGPGASGMVRNAVVVGATDPAGVALPEQRAEAVVDIQALPSPETTVQATAQSPQPTTVPATPAQPTAALQTGDQPTPTVAQAAPDRSSGAWLAAAAVGALVAGAGLLFFLSRRRYRGE